MNFFSRKKHYETFIEVFEPFITIAGGGDLADLVDVLYGRFHIENEVYNRELQRVLLFDYFKNVVIPHKIAVLSAGMEMSRTGILGKFLPEAGDKKEFLNNLWEHDLSKFSAAEATGYLNYDRATGKGKSEFEAAWHHHKNHNPHHPEYWFNPNREGINEPIAMPALYVLEMVCDWIGAGKTYGSSLEEWLPKNITKFRFGQSATLVKDVLNDLNVKTNLYQTGFQLRENVLEMKVLK